MTQQDLYVDPLVVDFCWVNQQTVARGVCAIPHVAPLYVYVCAADIESIIAAVGMLVAVKSGLKIR